MPSPERNPQGYQTTQDKETNTTSPENNQSNPTRLGKGPQWLHPLWFLKPESRDPELLPKHLHEALEEQVDEIQKEDPQNAYFLKKRSRPTLIGHSKPPMETKE